MTAEVQAEPGASGLCPGKWRAARVGVGPGEGWAHFIVSLNQNHRAGAEGERRLYDSEDSGSTAVGRVQS